MKATTNPALVILIGTLVLGQLGIGPTPDGTNPAAAPQASKADPNQLADSVVHLLNKLRPMATDAMQDLLKGAKAPAQQKVAAASRAAEASHGSAPLAQHVHLNFSRTHRLATPEEAALYERMKPIYDEMIARHEAKLAGADTENDDATEQK